MDSDVIRKKAASQAIHKTLQLIEDEFELELGKKDKFPPTKRRKITIDLLKDKIEGDIDKVYEGFDEFTESAIKKWYKIGARRGALEMLKLLIDDGMLSDDAYERLVTISENTEWKCRLNYTKFNGEKEKLKRKKYSINLKKVLTRL